MFSTKFRIKPLGTSSRFVYVKEWSSEREVPLKSGVTEEWEGDLVTKCYSGRAILPLHAWLHHFTTRQSLQFRM